VALPLVSYYAVTLGLPLANGAPQSGAPFARHALVVLVVPPVMIVLGWGARRTFQAIVGATVRSVSTFIPRAARAARRTSPASTP
jgi:hypothetical protein